MVSCIARVILFSLPFGLFTTPLFSQAQGLGARSPCGPCQIELSPELLLGTQAGPGILSGSFDAIARDKHGRFYVNDSQASHQVMVFDSNGEFLQTIGQQGGGPGEFQNIGVLTINHDSLHVFDDANLRETIFNSNYEMVKEISMPYRPQDVIALEGGFRAMNINIPTSELVGIPLHIVSAEGDLLASFGGRKEPFRTDISYLGHRRLADGDGRSFWAADRLQYKFQKWDVNGKLLRSFSRNVSWFPPSSQWHGFHQEEPPAPLLWDIQSDDRGYLWVLISVADKNWQDALTRVEDEHGERWIPGQAINYFDTMIEVIDPQSNEVVASQRFDPLITHFADEGHVAGPWQGNAVAPTVRVWQVKLIQRR